jgi:hypothetical protein
MKKVGTSCTSSKYIKKLGRKNAIKHKNKKIPHGFSRDLIYPFKRI